MKHLLWTLTASLLMISCGDFYQFGEEPDDWDGVSMRITNAESCVMVGDSMPLGIEFSDTSKIGSPVFWMLSDPNIAKLHNDTLHAVYPGAVDIIAISGNGLLTDTCRVRVIDRWEAGDFHRWHPSDMVIYADISIDGKPWDSSTYTWEDIFGFSDEEINRYKKVIESTAHLIMEFSQKGGFSNAANL